MKIVGRIIAVIALILIVLFAAAALILPRVIHPDTYKNQLIALVKQKTGRTLTINGRIGLSFFPWLGVRLSQASLGNPPGFRPGDFAAVGSADIRVKLLPLLRRRVVVDEVRLSGLRLNLVKSVTGHTNWSDLTGTPATTVAPSPRPSPARRTPMVQALSVAGVDIHHADIVFSNEQTGATISVHHLALTMGRVMSGRPVSVRLSALVQTTDPAVSTHIKGHARLTFNENTKSVRVRHLRAIAAGVTLEGGAVVNLAPAPHVKGHINVPVTDVRALLRRFGIVLRMRDPRALTAVALSAGIAGSPQAITIRPLQATVDGSRLTGFASIAQTGSALAYRFALDVDQLDLDRYRARSVPPFHAAPATPRRQSGSKPAGGFLRTLDARGRIKMGRLTVFGIHAAQIRARLVATGGIINLDPMQAQLYGGTDHGSVRYDVRNASPAIAVQESLTHIALGPLLRDAKTFDKFSGVGDLSAQVTAQGTTPTALTKTLNGDVRLALTQGQIQGLDLSQLVSKAQTLYQGLRGQPTTTQPASGGHTDFSTLTASATIRHGVVQNQDLMLAAPPYFDATGRGLVDLVAKTMNYQLDVTAKGGGGKAVTVPVTVQGPFSGLSYHVNLIAALHAREQGRIKAERQKLKSRLEQELNRKLKGLLR